MPMRPITRDAAPPTRHRAVSVVAALVVALVVGACAGPAAVRDATVSPTSPTPVVEPPITTPIPPASSPRPAPTDDLDTGGTPARTDDHSPAAPWTPASASAPEHVETDNGPRPSAPEPEPEPAQEPEPFAIRLSDASTFVGQYTFEWCVGASIQMALAMTTGSADRSRARQAELWEVARDRSFSPYGGANPRGWVAALNDLGAGPYELVSIPTFDGAVRAAAAALSETGRPVGLVMWRGRHAWVMSGFESIGDPAVRPDAEVTAVRVLDPLHPHGSSVWGTSPKPDSLIGLDRLAEQFVAREYRPSYDLGVPGGWLLVLPTVTEAGAAG